MSVKCLVWDLDDTLWDGVVLEGDDPEPFPAALGTLRTLDHRGILHAVASRGEHNIAVAHLAKHGLTGMFTVVEVGWGAKSAAVARIVEALNIGAGTVAFIDNDALERAEVAGAVTGVRCYRADQVGDLPSMPEFTPEFVTDESRMRREMYRVESHRKTAEEDHIGPPADFLAGLDLVMTIRRADETDLARAHELTVRTNQLNTTGRTFGIDELRRLRSSPDHEVLVASLSDRFGPYGTIGLAVTERRGDDTVLQLLLMSCRVMSRGAGAAFIDHLVRTAHAAGRRIIAEFVPTAVNRIMLVTLRFSGFVVIGETDSLVTLAVADPPPARPAHVRIEGGSSAA